MTSIFLACLFLLCPPVQAEVGYEGAVSLEEAVILPQQLRWLDLEPGLEAVDIPLMDEAHLSILRIDPTFFDFVLCASSQHGALHSLSRWSDIFGLTAAINAGMYLPDIRTNVGYLRDGSHVNQKRVSQRPGAFFVAGPEEASLPAVAILERGDPHWQHLDHFRLVIQNYRMIDSQRNILWQQGGPPSAIAAVGEDGQGHILFIYCPEEVDPYYFCRWLLDLPLDIRTVMYVEGGSQAGLAVRSVTANRDLGGSIQGFLQGLVQKAKLPNVLGIRPKAKK